MFPTEKSGLKIIWQQKTILASLPVHQSFAKNPLRSLQPAPPRHYVAGGCTHEFTDKGWTFDTGVQYVGRSEKYGHLAAPGCRDYWWNL